jgi:hypothetical protein
MRFWFACSLLVFSFGCSSSVQNEYVWTRQEPAMARGSPTTYVVRISVDPKTKSVVWFEDVHDDDGDLGRNTKTWTGCTFLDSDNWRCETGAIGGQIIPDDIEMKEGQLFQRYWSEQRKFVRRRNVFGVRF